MRGILIGCARIFVLLPSILLVSACGDDGQDSPVPSVQVTLTSPSVSEELAVGDEFPINVAGSWSGKNVEPQQVFLQVRDTAARFTTPPSKSGSSGESFTFVLHTVPTIAAGDYSGQIEVRACRDAGCVEPYSGARATVAYSLAVATVTDWETHQRDAAHRGYVPIWLNPARFAKVWEWNRELDDPIGGINAVVTADEKVYVTKDVWFGEGVLYALSEVDGTEVWKVSFGQVQDLNPPAVSDGRVYTSITAGQDTALWAFDANTGAYLRKSPFESQGQRVLAPTVYGDHVYIAGGYYGGATYSFSTADGSREWVHTAGDDDMFTPAVGDTYVVHHTGNALALIDRATGTQVAMISDPFGSSSGYSYHGAPVIGGRHNVVSFAGEAFSGRASSNIEQYEQRVFSSFDTDAKSYEWSTSSAYMTVPAVAGGVIYAGGNSPMSFDAIDEATGQVLWSWVPSGNGDTSFHRNVVVTRNIVFVSTDVAVYALDLATRTPVWSYPQPGMLAISADRTLYIATGARESDGHLVAIKMK
jgi:outer membrane protein assembly factor BamB